MGETATEETKNTAIGAVRRWGESPVPPVLLATLITAQHLRPPQYIPLFFSLPLLLSSYMNLGDYKKDAAGQSAAWSGLYFVMARRRKQAFSSKWSVRGVVRGATMGLCAANVVGGGVAYALNSRAKED